MAGRTGYDLTPIADWHSAVTGIQRVVVELVRPALDRADAEFVVWNTRPARGPLGWLRLDGAATVANVGSGAVLHGPDAGGAFEGLGAGDVFVSLKGEWSEPGYRDSLLRWAGGGARIVQVIYDLLPIVRPQFSAHSADTMGGYLEAVAPAVDRWVAISEHTAGDLRGWLGANGANGGGARIDVLRLGDDPVADLPQRRPAVLSAGFQPGGFVLCVGTVEARKNHRLLYHAYRHAARHGVVLPPLVIAGRVWFGGEDVAGLFESDPLLAGRVALLRHPPDEELAWLYANCRFTAYPSEYEGWGLPVAESLARGKPVVASDASSIPEIAGALVDYVDPYSVEECVAALARLSDDAALAEATARAAQYAPTPWAESAAAFDAIVAAVGASGGPGVSEEGAA